PWWGGGGGGWGGARGGGGGGVGRRPPLPRQRHRGRTANSPTRAVMTVTDRDPASVTGPARSAPSPTLGRYQAAGSPRRHGRSLEAVCGVRRGGGGGPGRARPPRVGRAGRAGGRRGAGAPGAGGGWARGAGGGGGGAGG